MNFAANKIIAPAIIDISIGISTTDVHKQNTIKINIKTIVRSIFLFNIKINMQNITINAKIQFANIFSIVFSDVILRKYKIIILQMVKNGRHYRI